MIMLRRSMLGPAAARRLRAARSCPLAAALNYLDSGHSPECHPRAQRLLGGAQCARKANSSITGRVVLEFGIHPVSHDLQHLRGLVAMR